MKKTDVKNNDKHISNFLDTKEALKSKYEADNSETKIIGDLNDFNNWINKIAKR